MSLKLFRLVTLFVLSIMTLTVFTSSNVSAAGTEDGTAVREDNTFYLYVNTGEKVDITFTKRADLDFTNTHTATLRLEKPGATTKTCSLPDSGTGCGWADELATANQVWRVVFDAPNVTAVNNVFFKWSIVVNQANGTTPIPGRVWTDYYIMASTQMDNGSPESTGNNLIRYYRSKEGYTYKATYRDYYGVDSIFSATNLGIVKDQQSCQPLYESIKIPTVTSFALRDLVVESQSNCGGVYKLFFEQPASDLPVEASSFDSQMEWLNPTPGEAPTVTEAQFIPTSADSSTGKLSYVVNNFTGATKVMVDTNGNNVFTDPVDLTLSGVQKNLDNSPTIVEFDGKDGLGNPIAYETVIKFKIMVDKNAEIHFVSGDVEKRGGGISVERLNGPTEGRDIVYWDDRKLEADPEQNKCSLTPVMDGTAGQSSTSGVHGWGFGFCSGIGNFNDGKNGSWGDAYLINDWAFVSTNITSEVSFKVPTPATVDTPIPIAPKTGIIAGSIAVLLGCSAFIVAKAIQNKKAHKLATKKGEK
jgi:hypothetical protein